MSKIVTQFEDIKCDQIRCRGDVIHSKHGTFAFISTPAATTIVTAGVYYPIAGIYTNDPLEGFIVNGDAIEYRGQLTRDFKVDWHASLSVLPTGATVKVGIKKDGVLVDSSVMQTYAATLILQMSGCTVIELSQGNNVQLVVTSDADGDAVTFHNYTTSIDPFFAY